jgi:hypothetical protein
MKLDHRKYHRLLNDSAGLNKALNQTGEKRRELITNVRTAENAVNAHVESLGGLADAFLAGTLDERQRARIPAQCFRDLEDMEELRADLADLEAVEARQAEAWHQKAGPVSELERFFTTWKDRLPRADRIGHEAPKGKPPTLADLHRIRAKVSEIRERLGWLTDAPLPLAEARERFSAQFDAFAADFRLPWRIAGLFDVERGFSDALKAMTHPAGNVNLGPLLCALFPEIRERFLSLMDGYAGTVEMGPPTTERPRLLRDLEAELFRLEIEEERVITALESTGHDVARRGNANPAAILGIFETADPWAEWLDLRG